MNKKQLIDDIAKRAELSKVEAGLVLNGFIEAISNALNAGDKVSLVGFGQVSKIDVPARTGRNPQTGEEIVIPAHKKVVFKPGKKLKDAIN
ncbi:HU family DNA-binding protein [Pseudomonas faucium]|uniref:HU family DNA-binding protein n=1 Tax=Pseudomonas faucium TaxID=2740518 RepID=UPI001F25F549|nr:HU family DNA-binding protein [Pseudomonas faucium]